MTLSAIDATAFERATDPVLGIFTREQAQHLAGYQGDAKLRERIELLAQKSNEGELSEEELAEYQGYVRANKFIALLQAKARKILAQP